MEPSGTNLGCSQESARPNKENFGSNRKAKLGFGGKRETSADVY